MKNKNDFSHEHRKCINSNFKHTTKNKIHPADENKTLHEKCLRFIASLSYPQPQRSTSIHIRCLPLPHFVSNSCCFYEYQKTFYLAVPFYKWYMYTGCQYVCDNPEYVQAVMP